MTAEIGHVPVRDCRLSERQFEPRSAEVRMTPRRRKPPHVDDQRDAVRLQRFQEGLEGAVRMPDRKHRHVRWLSALCLVPCALCFSYSGNASPFGSGMNQLAMNPGRYTPNPTRAAA